MHGLNHPKQNKKTELASNICGFPQISYLDRMRKSLFLEIKEMIEIELERQRQRQEETEKEIEIEERGRKEERKRGREGEGEGMRG